MPRLKILILSALLLIVPPAFGQGVGQVVLVDTRPSVTERLVLLVPETPPKAVLLLFPGGNGTGSFRETAGGVRLGINFLVRTAPLVAAKGFVAAVVDVPSDQVSGMSDAFRTSREHAADIMKVLEFLAGRWAVPVFLVGTSRGTVSAAFLAAALEPRRVAGVVLTSSVGATNGRPPFNLSLFTLQLERITIPVLFVHHRHDECWASLFADAQRLRVRTTAAKTDFIEVLGGSPPRTDPCEPLSAHGFIGKEAEVVNAIIDWTLGRPVPARIGP